MKTLKSHYSLEEVAEMLGVTYQLIYRLVRSGELPAVRLGRLYRVSKRDLEQFLERSKQAVADSVAKCAACGTSYNSMQSLQQSCVVSDCEGLICNDCWLRLKRRKCSEHEQHEEK